MFEAQLKKLGLQAVVSEGEPFNPEVHEAVELAIVPREQDGVVITELQRGYKFGERLLRPARVKVGRSG
jgi:molecular chaperone GrpE (heat shock protein)